ncbi:hypothetical protein N1027_16490 [Herbiconiux sp. CPCC 205763]|uniref:Alpha-galactosidase NEW3 domain-containing protein n=1 Tax=Herbiconiux aconitum TaxID=2970913 RepID=A0ABT2GUA1_9MICO|nr:hypothetical protein [Herbiconiux aconitum]MCS5719733.1 hypothetical protein [Herbiconiux aconitum]
MPSPGQTTTYQTVPDEFNLTVSPTRLIVGPDDTEKTHEVSVVNRGTAPVHVDMSAKSFVGGIDGTLVFQEDAPYSASEWVDVSPMTFDLQPGTKQVVTITIVVPPEPESGDHQVALVFLVPAGETDANIKVNRGVAIPVYITVPGPIDDSAAVSELAAPGFSAGGTVKVTATVENTGTVHRDFRGDTALPIDGGGSTSFPDFTVVRGGEREISAEWQPPLMCICNVSVSIANTGGVSTTQTVQVIVFPVLPAIILVGGIALVILLVVFAYKQYQKGVRQAAVALQASGGADG